MNKPSPEQLERLRIRVAELCGWTFNGTTKSGRGCCPRRPGDMQYMGTMNVPLKEQWTPPADWSGHPGTPLPENFPEDLNACHEAEKLIFEDRFSKVGSSNSADHAPMRYVSELSKVCGVKTKKERAVGPRGIILEHFVFASSGDYLKFSRAEAWKRCVAIDRCLSEMPIL